MKTIIALIMLLIPTFSVAEQTPTVCHNELSAWIKSQQTVSIVDIQAAEGFRVHHYDGSLAASRDPAGLRRIASRLRSTTGKVIVVSATGGGDALRAREELVRGGVGRSRILLLEGGMEAAAGNAACDCCKTTSLQGKTK